MRTQEQTIVTVHVSVCTTAGDIERGKAYNISAWRCTIFGYQHHNRWGWRGAWDLIRAKHFVKLFRQFAGTHL